jgi:hypothetical protein
MPSYGAFAVLELVTAVLVEITALLLVLANVLVDTLHGYHRIVFLSAIAHNLFRRPLPFTHIAIDAVLYFAREGAFSTQTFLTDIN